MASISKLRHLPGTWGLLLAMAESRLVEIWGKLARQQKGSLIRYVDGKGKVCQTMFAQRKIVSWKPHPDRR